MKRFLKIGLSFLAMFFVLAAASFLCWALWIPPHGQIAAKAIISDEIVTVSTDPYLTFSPANGKPQTGLIFYPGARVTPEAYASIARSVASESFLVVIPSMPLNMALFAPHRASEVMSMHPDIRYWAIGGHSMGGAFAAQFIAQRPETISGLVLVGAYPPNGIDLSTSAKEVVSIYGSVDGIATPAEVLAAKPFLPPMTEWVEVNGGNHAQFGDYGSQFGDSEPYVTADQQQRVTGTSIIGLLKRISANSQ